VVGIGGLEYVISTVQESMRWDGDSDGWRSHCLRPTKVLAPFHSWVEEIESCVSHCRECRGGIGSVAKIKIGGLSEVLTVCFETFLGLFCVWR